MSRIRLLPEQVANQIAAGEVVERPASVVKELVENALDAGAARLTVEIQAGGRSLIRVTDDGVGMNRDDALLCLERHATSKIRRAEDLAAIDTMGFRGEALPSIASVSRMTLTTLERDGAGPATQIVINGGKLLEVKAAGSPPGTSVEVRQLFFNLPARRKFLRSEETEYGHIHHYLTLAALAYPEVAMTFLRDQRPVWQLPAVAREETPGGRLTALRERTRALSGWPEPLLAVDFSVEIENPPGRDPASASEEAQAVPSFDLVRVWGLMGGPGLSRSSRQDQHLFVNRRPVENRGLNMALLEGYHTALMKGRYPVCCLFLEINPANVDVNIHPAKREVKFHNERAVRRLVAQAVRGALLDFHGGAVAPSNPASASRSGAPAEFAPPRSAPQPAGPGAETDSGPGPRQTAPGASTSMELPGWSNRDPILPARSSRAPESAEAEPAGSPSSASAPPRSGAGSLPTQPEAKAGSDAIWTDSPSSLDRPSSERMAPADDARLPLLDVPLRLVGVIGRLYVVLESDRGLVLMDQHAAHERILFEQMLHRLERGLAASQRLLLPETVELSVRDVLFLRGHLETLNRMGVGLSEFGERTFLLDALPPFVKVSEPRRFIVELVDELKGAGQEVNTMRLGEQTIAKTVCRHAVKANDPLGEAELENLLRDLRHCAMPYTCPHGRPTLIEMNFRELEKKFGRLV
jgi:DNA mismatch repair protein MutL